MLHSTRLRTLLEAAHVVVKQHSLSVSVELNVAVAQRVHDALMQHGFRVHMKEASHDATGTSTYSRIHELVSFFMTQSYSSPVLLTPEMRCLF